MLIMNYIMKNYVITLILINISKIFQSFDEILEVKEEEFTMIETTGYFENPIIMLNAKLIKKQAQNQRCLLDDLRLHE